MFYNKTKNMKSVKNSTGNVDTVSLYDVASISLLSLVTDYLIIRVAISDPPQAISYVSTY
jgi:hypothetical protein